MVLWMRSGTTSTLWVPFKQGSSLPLIQMGQNLLAQILASSTYPSQAAGRRHQAARLPLVQVDRVPDPSLARAT
jgi:hypothetical protein